MSKKSALAPLLRICLGSACSPYSQPPSVLGP